MQVAVEVRPVRDEYVPATQFIHCNEADSPETDDHVPPTQLRQVAIEVTPDPVEYVPG